MPLRCSSLASIASRLPSVGGRALAQAKGGQRAQAVTLALPRSLCQAPSGSSARSRLAQAKQPAMACVGAELRVVHVRASQQRARHLRVHRPSPRSRRAPGASQGPAGPPIASCAAQVAVPGSRAPKAAAGLGGRQSSLWLVLRVRCESSGRCLLLAVGDGSAGRWQLWGRTCARHARVTCAPAHSHAAHEKPYRWHHMQVVQGCAVSCVQLATVRAVGLCVADSTRADSARNGFPRTTRGLHARQ
jgi:hypothetical protein